MRAWLIVFGCVTCLPATAQEVAGNPDVAQVMKTFVGRGVMRDDSTPTMAREAVSRFTIRGGLEIELVASEPEISQPLFLAWDSRCRLWVMEYRQYQFPAGLKIVRYDEHLRAVFDRTPKPPPHGPRGADRISILEDTNGDGNFDSRRTFVDGLNIATSMAVGHDGVWVLNPPYLLFYPDEDQDDVPDGPPEVHLSGFGLQDTHAVANSLTLAPDGWLYGANGSTTVGDVSSSVTAGVRFEGQCIWRYHPIDHRFEIYAEGGGNTFSFEFDSHGRVFSGTNGGKTRGWYYPQGSYSQKNWGKHGPLTNSHAYGFFPPMNLEGDTRRFAQAFCIYEGGLFPKNFARTVIAANSLHNLVWHSELIPDGSTYRTIDNENLLETPDRWFRPVYVGVGPEGAVYLADWYDTRLSHVSPLDDWHKESGRVYRITPTDRTLGSSTGDLRNQSPAELLALFTSKNKWVRHRAAMELRWRQDQSIGPQLLQTIKESGSLEALWSLHGLGRLDEEQAEKLLGHPNPDVRRWVVRLLGDDHRDHPALARLAKLESNIHVRSQLASTAKRLSAPMGLDIVSGLLEHHDDVNDPHLPLLIWWAIESHAESNDRLLGLFAKPNVWDSPITRQFILQRMLRRDATIATKASLARCARLLELAPDESARNEMLRGLNLAFQGRPLPALPEPVHQAYQSYREEQTGSPLVFGVRRGDPTLVKQAISLLANPSQEFELAMEVAAAFAETPNVGAQATLLALATGSRSSNAALQRTCLVTLRRYESTKIAKQILAKMSSLISEEHGLRATAFRTLAMRPHWAALLLEELQSQWRVRRDQVPQDVIQQLRSYEDESLAALTEGVFGKLSDVTTPSQLAEMKRLRELFSADQRPRATGDRHAGAVLFEKKCAACHQLFGSGGRIGPALDGYQRGKVNFWINGIVVPNLEIREGFQSYLALTEDGRTITGLVTHQTADSVTIASGTLGQEAVTLQRQEIEILKALPTSLMPTGLLSDLTDQQIRDLFAYLSQGAF